MKCHHRLCALFGPIHKHKTCHCESMDFITNRMISSQLVMYSNGDAAPGSLINDSPEIRSRHIDKISTELRGFIMPC